ncbi:MAG: phosphopantothenoylcysteine decarboxylase [Opitutales bacterium]|nr:phosphopantothenoylcysteine decarboxylase [Opitutales bacterium]
MELEKLKGRKIVLGVCSSIAAYKAADLASRLSKAGADVRVIMTQNARKIISERVFSTLSRNPVAFDMWGKIDDWRPEHISLADFAEVLLVAPATANTIGNFANGLAPDLLSSTYLATRAKVLIAPAMNDKMYAHPAVQKNIETLLGRGVKFVGPASGALACGDEGRGRLAEVEDILSALRALF